MVVFETHVEREITAREEIEKKREYGHFSLKAPERVVVQLVYPFFVEKTSIRVRNTPISLATLARNPQVDFPSWNPDKASAAERTPNISS